MEDVVIGNGKRKIRKVKKSNSITILLILLLVILLIFYVVMYTPLSNSVLKDLPLPSLFPCNMHGVHIPAPWFRVSWRKCRAPIGTKCSNPTTDGKGEANFSFYTQSGTQNWLKSCSQ
jgi:flagellar basal body-associated protein FliL